MIVAITPQDMFMLDEGELTTPDIGIELVYEAVTVDPIMPWEGFIDTAIYNRMLQYLDGCSILYEREVMPEKGASY